MSSLLIAVVLVTLAGKGFCAQVEFYMNNNYGGLVGRGIPTSEVDQCFELEPLARNEVSSARVIETCVLLFDQAGCSGNSIKLEEDAPNFAQLAGNKTNDNFDDKALSFRFCGAGEGEESANKVEFYNEVDYTGTPIAIYTDSCKCISVPEAVLVNVSSVDNHHNCIELYSSQNCGGAGGEVKAEVPVRIFAGRSSLSSDLTGSSIFGNLKSFIPCKIPKGCVKLDAKLFHFEFNEAPEEMRVQATEKSMSMSAKTVVWNNGSALVSQEYAATRAVRETIEVETIDVHRTVQTWTTETTTTTTMEVNAIFFKYETTKTVKDTYSRTEEHQKTERRKETTDVLTEFTARQTITLNPCHYYEVESFVKVIENYPVPYKVFFKFSGVDNEGNRMTALTLKKVAEAEKQFVYVEDIDNFTISAYAPSQITVSFGVETEIIGNGYRIPGCYVNPN